MSTATPTAAPAITPGSQTSENKLATLVAFVGIALLIAGLLVDLLHPLGDLGHQLRLYGVSLLSGSVGLYAGFRTVLKVVTQIKGYEGMANVAAAALPGSVGAAAQHYLPIIESLIDKVAELSADAPAPAPAPTAVAAAAGAQAAANPAATL